MSGDVDLKQLSGKFEPRGVFEVNEVVGTWEVNISECPVNPLKIKVMRYVDGVYLGVANYSIKGPGESSPYRSLRLVSNAQEAVDDALSGFLSHFDPEKLDHTTFIQDEQF